MSFSPIFAWPIIVAVTVLFLLLVLWLVLFITDENR